MRQQDRAAGRRQQIVDMAFGVRAVDLDAGPFEPAG
jgi:hypothetical protein